MQKLELESCPGCNVLPGEPHIFGCEIEMCSQCGNERRGGRCGCTNHDVQFSRWTGFIPGLLEAKTLGIEYNDVFETGLNRILFIKPEIMKLNSKRGSIHE